MAWPERPANWLDYDRHRLPARLEWGKRVISDTSGSDARATYRPNTDRQAVETQCAIEGLTNGQEIGQDEDNEEPHIRRFWMDCGEVIGASGGKETTYIFVQWEVSGGVNEIHGRPITKEQLQKKGVKFR